MTPLQQSYRKSISGHSSGSTGCVGGGTSIIGATAPSGSTRYSRNVCWFTSVRCPPSPTSNNDSLNRMGFSSTNSIRRICSPPSQLSTHMSSYTKLSRPFNSDRPLNSYPSSSIDTGSSQTLSIQPARSLQSPQQMGSTSAAPSLHQLTRIRCQSTQCR